MQKLHTPQPALLDLHPVELLLLALMALAWALATVLRTVLVPLIALLLVALGGGRGKLLAAQWICQFSTGKSGQQCAGAKALRRNGSASFPQANCADSTGASEPLQRNGSQGLSLSARAPLDAPATDLATALEHSTPAKLTARLDPDQVGMSQVHTSAGARTLTFVTESGFSSASTHPLAALADELQRLSCRQLRQMAGAAARKHARKQELIEALLFCG